jgi:SAM-dependent methyltransferase
MTKDAAVIHWNLSNNIKQKSLELMNFRAADELKKTDKKIENLKDVHGETIRDYPAYAEIIQHLNRLFPRQRQNLLSADLGSGTGVGACLLSKLKIIKEVLAVEYSEGFVTDIMPMTFSLFGAKTNKIKTIVGDFNNLQLPDGQLDLILELGAFHHSENLALTLAESYRVLKKGGLLVAVERAHPDRVKDEYLKQLLERQLPEHIKLKYGINPEINFTRKMWGEHEYRVRDWIKYFQEANFKVKTIQFTKLKYFNAVENLNKILNYLQWLTLFPKSSDKAFDPESKWEKIYIFNRYSFKTCFIGIK